MVIGKIKNILSRSIVSKIGKLFKKRKIVRIGLYGPVNSGKTTLANVISMDWLGEPIGKVSHIPHETRQVIEKEHIEVKHNNKKIVFNLVDTPGIATKIDFEDFVKKGLKKKEAKQRAKEATQGVIEAIKWLDRMDLVLVVLDATRNPIDQVNVTILGNLEARKIPFIVIANKIDLKRANAHRIRTAFPQYDVVAISAKNKYRINELYSKIMEKLGI